jgi:hypothetical protein
MLSPPQNRLQEITFTGESEIAELEHNPGSGRIVLSGGHNLIFEYVRVAGHSGVARNGRSANQRMEAELGSLAPVTSPVARQIWSVLPQRVL